MIEIIGLTKSFENKRVLDNINMSFENGANCLMGDSGVGKTTLVRIMLGLLRQDSGEIRGLKDKKINCVFQENRLIEELSAIKNIRLVCGRDKVKKANELLIQMGLEDSIDCPISTLSGGMKRRVAIARALINPADIYIFDEPFKGLDDMRKESIVEIIKFHTQNAITIYVTHDINDVQILKAKMVQL